MKKQRAVRWAEPDSEQKSGIKRVSDLLGNVSFPFLFLLFALVAVLKSIVIHQHLVNLTGTDLGRRVVTGPFQPTDIYSTLVNYARPRKCTSVWKGDFLLPEPVSPRFLIHKSGYQRNVVHVYEGKRNFSIKMSGDQTAVVSGGDGDDPVSRLLVNKVNYERMLLSGGKE